MELTVKTAILIIGIVCTGLTAGLCFTWSNAVTPGIGRLDDLTFLKAFQAMNRAILNGPFMVVFMSPTLLLFLNAYLFKNSNSLTFWCFMVAALLFFVGIGWVTVFKNIPLNEVLDKTNLATATSVELKELRTVFETPWNYWHGIRTIASISAFILLLIGAIMDKS